MAAALWAGAGSAWVLPLLSPNADESLYLLQADTLLEGQLAPETPETEAEAFTPWFSTIENGRYVLKYTPVHAAVIAATSLAMTVPRLALASIAAIQVVVVAWLAREMGIRRTTSLVAALLFGASPLIVHLSLTYLPYSTSLVLGGGTAALALRAARTDRVLPAAGAGLLWGFAVFARPYDGLLWLLIVAAGVVGRRGLDAVGRLGLHFALGSAAPIAMLLLTNELLTGSPLQLPFNLLEPNDTIWFGNRRAYPGDPFFDYTLGRAATALGRNLVLVLGWTGGGLVSAALGGWAIARGRVPNASLLVAMFLIWPIGYALFWGSYVSVFLWDSGLFMGPYYYFPVALALSLAGAVGLVELLERQRVAGSLGIIACAVISVSIGVPAINEELDRSSQREDVVTAIDEHVEEPALVFVEPLYGPFLLNPLSFLRNAPGLDGDIVYAVHRTGPDDQRVMDMFPERTPYRLIIAGGWSDLPDFDPDVRVVEIGPRR